MQKFLQTFLLALCILPIAELAYAQRTPEPLVNHAGIRYAPASGKMLTENEVKSVMRKAATKLQWTLSDGKNPQSLIGTLVVRHKHTIQIDIKLEPSTYSVTYRDSVNMNYAKDGLNAHDQLLIGLRPPSYFEGKDQPVIHPNYNRWVNALIQSINSEIRQL